MQLVANVPGIVFDLVTTFGWYSLCGVNLVHAEQEMPDSSLRFTEHLAKTLF